MRKCNIAKLYDRLTPVERFRMILDARARQDAPEVSRLLGSIPRRVYEMDDWDAVSLNDAALRMAAAFLILWHGAYGHWLLTHYMERAAKKGQRSKGAPATRLSDEDFVHAYASVRNAYTGLDRICARVGLDAQHFLHAMLAPVAREVATMRDMVEPLAEYLEDGSETIATMFARAWDDTPLDLRPGMSSPGQSARLTHKGETQS